MPVKLPPDLRQELPAIARRAPVVLGLNTAVALLMWHFMEHRRLDEQLVNVHAIGVTSWLLIDVGRFVFGQPGSPDRMGHGWRKLLFLAFGVVTGYIAGTLVSDAYSGRSTWALLRQAPDAFLSLAGLSLLIGSAIVYFFYTRGELQYHRAQAEAARREALETQLKLLESQLEPHMLFNTLANLRALIALDPPRAQAMLDRMIAFLRATLNASRTELHPLRLEFERLADYLELMRIRMGDRLATRLELPPACAGLPVPPLLLQPLVENAIKHGLEPCVDGGRVEVSAALDGDRLVLRVRDTGVGLPHPKPGADGDGFGLDQVRRRLSTMYGGHATLRLVPADDAAGGTLAEIRLPLSPTPPEA